MRDILSADKADFAVYQIQGGKGFGLDERAVAAFVAQLGAIFFIPPTAL